MERVVRDYRDPRVWHRAHELTLAVYAATAAFPRDEVYGLTSQVRRACSSIPANIAEGGGRRGDVELTRFLQLAAGSASELDYHLLLARDLGFLPISDYDRLVDHLNEVRKMLTSLIQRLRATQRHQANDQLLMTNDQ